MVEQFLTSAGAPSGVQSGTLVLPDGHARHLRRFTIAADAPAIRPAGSQASYPQAWTVSVPGAHLRLRLRSLARNQFVWMAFLPSFWEGAAAITQGPPGACAVESSRELTVDGL
jgi:predicted secreted hydrolase